MLSVGRRVDGHKRIGFGGAMEENELEEGEAYSVQEDDAFVDPDIDLSYIDEKLQSVLGHAQRDFEGGATSDEKLAPMLGKYGTFLPVYMRSPPMASQPETPSWSQNHVASRSPCEGARQNPSLSTSVSVSRNNIVPAPPLLENSSKKFTQSAQESLPQHSAASKTVNSCEHRTLKVRIKVTSEGGPPRSNAAIYSGLGLDISPSSSSEERPNGSDELQDVPNESPRTILKIMTCFQVPGGCLLSPLPYSMLHLVRKESPLLKHHKEGFFNIERDVNYSTKKKRKSSDKSRKVFEVKKSGSNDGIAEILEMDIDNETTAGQEIVSNALNISLLSTSKDVDENEIGQTPPKPVKNLMSKTVSLQDQFRKQTEATCSSFSFMGNDGNQIEAPVVTLTDKLQLNRKMHLDSNVVNKFSEETKDANFMDNPLVKGVDSKFKKRKKSEMIGDPHASKSQMEKFDSVKGKFSQKVTAIEEIDGSKMRGKDQRPQGKEKLSTTQLPRLTKQKSKAVSTVASKGKKKGTHAKGDHIENKCKTLKAHKELPSKLDTVDAVVDLFNNKPKEVKLEYDESLKLAEKAKERLARKKTDDDVVSVPVADEPKFVPPVSNAATESVATTNAPTLVQDNWVCCDKCEMWRLFPPEWTNVGLLDKWTCSMQSWLPAGMNRCHISEEETNKAFYALYQAPASNNVHQSGPPNVAAASVTLADTSNVNQVLHMPNTPTSGKKKIGVKAALSPFNSVKRAQHASNKGRKLDDMNRCPPESSSLNVMGVTGIRKASSFASDEHKHRKREKHKIRMHYSHEGDLNEEGTEQLKLKNKRGLELTVHRAYKRPKAEVLNYSHEDQKSDLDLSQKATTYVSNGSSDKMSKRSRKDPALLFMDVHGDSLRSFPSSNMNSQGQVPLNGHSKEHCSSSHLENSKKADSLTKKSKLKEWKGSDSKDALITAQHPVDDSVGLKVALIESEPSTGKKAKLTKPAFKEVSARKEEGKMDKKGRLTKVVLSDSRDNICDPLAETNKFTERELKLDKHRENEALRCDLDVIAAVKKDLGNVRAANSSSSKVSCSLNNIANLNDSGSPVESVSSSPLRTCSGEKSATGSGKNDGIRLCCDISPKNRYEGEADGGSGIRRKRRDSPTMNKSIRAANPEVPDSSTEILSYKFKEARALPVTRTIDGMPLKKVDDDYGGIECEDKSDTYNTVSTMLQQRKYYCHVPRKDVVDGQTKAYSNHLMNGCSQQTLAKASSHSKEKYRNCKVDVCNVKDADEGMFYAKSVSSIHNAVNTILYEQSNDPRDFRNGEENFQEKDGKDHFRKESGAGKIDNHLSHGGEKKWYADDSDVDYKQYQNGSLTVAVASDGKHDVHMPEEPYGEGEKLIHSRDQFDQSETASTRAKLQSTLPSFVAEQIHSQGAHGKGNSSKGCVVKAYSRDASNSGASNMVVQSSKVEIQHGETITSLRQGTPNRPDACSPVTREGQPSANIILKEARDLKHLANRFKNEGDGIESTSLYFQAALKFLRYASLLEPPNVDIARNGEANQSIKWYSDTARLCEFVAHEYERRKDMASAALAYKCVEVAYMKVAYFKNSSASKDRHELKEALQAGESPSSSASDVDNLNHQSITYKATSAKAVNSPQVAGNHVIAARNRSNFVRLLQYTHETVCAFEASKKSQNAIAVATVSLGKNNGGAVTSVKKVLDFNFHNVESLLHLVRLSMEVINRR